MSDYIAVLIDVSSIQEYIFGSNKLKLNAGASYIIEHEVFGECLAHSLRQVTGCDISLVNWMNEPDIVQVMNGQVAEVAYIGGGNGLLLFKERDHAKEFIKKYSLEILLRYPGLKLSFALDETFSLDEGFKSSRNRIAMTLAANKQKAYKRVDVFKSGLSKDCLLSNESREINSSGANELISAQVFSKLQAFERAKKYYESALLKGRQLLFPGNLEDMSAEEEKSYIAVVHVDGNNMGNKFKNCNSLPELRKLSASVRRISNELLAELLEEVIRISELKDEEGNLIISLKNEAENAKTYLPFRPLISGGDDFTFICDGRLGVCLAEFLIRKFGEKQFGGEAMSACGGVAIVKTKYPFFRAYHLSEELTSEAKKRAKAKGKTHASTLHYLIVGGGFVEADYSHIIQLQFTCQHGSLVYGPYFISDGDNPSILDLKKGMRELAKSWPSNKLKELRSVLKSDTAEQDYFLKTLQVREKRLSLPHGHEGLWKDGVTPLYDMIELPDFYPNQLIG